MARYAPLWLHPGFVNATRELLQLTPVYEQVEGGWTQVGLAELPGVITAAPSREDPQELLIAALREFLLAFGRPGPGAATTADPDALMLTVSVGRAPARVRAPLLADSGW